MQTVSYLRYIIVVLTDMCTSVTHLTSGILCWKENIHILYQYLRVLASHKVNLLIVPPVNLFNILVKVKHDMRTNPRMELPDLGIHFHHKSNPCGHWWHSDIDPYHTSYWQVIADGFIQSPYPWALHLDLRVQFFYILQGQYLVNTYVAIRIYGYKRIYMYAESSTLSHEDHRMVCLFLLHY